MSSGSSVLMRVAPELRDVLGGLRLPGETLGEALSRILQGVDAGTVGDIDPQLISIFKTLHGIDCRLQVLEERLQNFEAMYELLGWVADEVKALRAPSMKVHRDAEIAAGRGSPLDVILGMPDDSVPEPSPAVAAVDGKISEGQLLTAEDELVLDSELDPESLPVVETFPAGLTPKRPRGRPKKGTQSREGR